MCERLMLQCVPCAMSHCVIEEIQDAPDLKVYDKSLGDLLVKGCDGDTKAFLAGVFDFLTRTSNFAKPGSADPEKTILDAWAKVRGGLAMESVMLTVS